MISFPVIAAKNKECLTFKRNNKRRRTKIKDYDLNGKKIKKYKKKNGNLNKALSHV